MEQLRRYVVFHFVFRFGQNDMQPVQHMSMLVGWYVYSQHACKPA